MKTLAALTLCILATALALEAPAANIGGSPGTLLSYHGTNILPRSSLDANDFGWDGTNITVLGGGSFDGDMNCDPLTEVHSQTDCNGCFTHYEDGAIGVPSGVIVYGCYSNSPAVGAMICSNEVWTTSELLATESGGFYSGTEHRFLRYVCREWDGDSWEIVDNQDVNGTVNIHGNLVLMSGWGTNIISAGSVGNILAGTNNGTIYLGPKSLGNSIHVNIGRNAGLHIGTNSSRNIIQGAVNDATAPIRIDNNVQNNRLSFLGDAEAVLRVRDNVFNSDIHALSIDGGIGSGWDVGNITNCSIRGVGANPYATYSASNLMGCTISTPTNVANLANAVVSGKLGLPGATVDGIDTTLSSSSSKLPTSAAVDAALTNGTKDVSFASVKIPGYTSSGDAELLAEESGGYGPRVRFGYGVFYAEAGELYWDADGTNAETAAVKITTEVP